jgi:hypothetical protein
VPASAQPLEPERAAAPAAVAAAAAPSAGQHDTAPIPPYQAPAQADAQFYEALKLPAEPPPVSPARKLWGALLAVAAVLLGIGAFLLFNGDDHKGTPVVALPTHRTTATHAPTPTPRATTKPTTRPTPSVATPVTATTAPAVVAPKRPVLVLNNSRIHGLADRSAATFRAGGWTVSGTGNYRGGIISRTTIYYAAGQLGSAQRFARQFGIPRVLPRFSGLPGSGLTVVLTRDYA